MSSIIYQGLKFTPNGEENVADNITEEGGLKIVINDEVFSITMRTPGNDEDLIRGLLYLEDVYTYNQPLVLSLNKKKDSLLETVNLTIEKSKLNEGYSNSRNLLSVSSCGICGKTALEDIKDQKKLFQIDKTNVIQISKMFKLFEIKQNDFNITGGSHAAAAFDLENNLLSFNEDIGRHNAVDKVVGNLLNNNNLSKAKVLLLSGRISYELIAKAFKAKIPIVAAISAPSSLAVDFAKELGITILGFCRDNRVTCYANPQRIK